MFVNNVLTHSKTEKGDGFVDNDAKLQAIVAAIREHRENKGGSNRTVLLWKWKQLKRRKVWTRRRSGRRFLFP